MEDTGTERQHMSITMQGGPIVRLAVICQDILEEKGTNTMTILRIIDGFQEWDSSPDGMTDLSGHLVFMGEGLPGEHDQEPVQIIISVVEDNDLRVIGVRDRMIDAQNGDRRYFAYGMPLSDVRLEYGHRYMFSLIHAGRELARVYTDVVFSADLGQPFPGDGHDSEIR